jgi:hypothetical protein
MQSGPRTTTRTTISSRQPGRAASFAARTKRWVSGASCPDPKRTQNAERNYDRYLALARAETINGNTVGAENYYQHVEHYYRALSSDSEPCTR